MQPFLNATIPACTSWNHLPIFMTLPKRCQLNISTLYSFLWYSKRTVSSEMFWYTLHYSIHTIMTTLLKVSSTQTYVTPFCLSPCSFRSTQGPKGTFLQVKGTCYDCNTVKTVSNNSLYKIFQWQVNDKNRTFGAINDSKCWQGIWN